MWQDKLCDSQEDSCKKQTTPHKQHIELK